MAKEFVNEDRLRKYFQDNNPGDESYVEKVFLDDSEKISLKKVLEKQFDELEDGNDLKIKNLDHIFYRIHYDITSKKEEKGSRISRFLKWSYRAAGIIFIPILIFMGVNLYKTSSNKESWVEIKAAAWTRARFSLPDGTTGWLNGNSSLKYRAGLTSERTVSLTGEAYFDVAKNPHKPFVVQTGQVNLKVLGTKFNVASYDDENNVEVVLAEGKLVFSDKENSKFYTMKPNDLVKYNKENHEFNVSVVQPLKYISWTSGKLVFRNDPIDIVLRRLERWYNVTIINNIPASEDLRWRATFEDEELEKVLDLMKRTLPINYKMEQPGINPDSIYSKKKVTITLK